jgi:hypothetical protein
LDKAGVFLTAFFAFLGTARSATPVLQTKNGAVVHWTKPLIEVGLDHTKPSRRIPIEGVTKALRLALSTWNENRVGQPQLYFKERGDPDIRVGFCQTRWLGGKVDLGHSEFSAEPRTGVVRAATVEINECDQAFFAPDEVGSHRHSLVSVLAHELGHTLGLGHADDPRSIMYPTGGGAGVRDPQGSDTSALAVIYLGRFPQAPLEAPSTPLPLPPPPTRKGQAALPDSASRLMTIKAKNGRELVVYTGEATLLPPLGGSGDRPERDPKPAKRKRKKRP